MRQLAIIVIMAQMGSYVPARSASYSAGAADDLVSGQSTFMVEVMEAKPGHSPVSVRSFSLMSWDGKRHDGIALAQAIIEHSIIILGQDPLCHHCHELSLGDGSIWKNVHVAALEKGQDRLSA